MAQLLSGKNAEDSLNELSSNPQLIPALAFDPTTTHGQLPKIAIIATSDQSLIIDISATPNLGEHLRTQGLFCAANAKESHHIALKLFGVAPRRWACIRLIETLLNGSDQAAKSPEILAEDYKIGPLPDPTRSLEAFGKYTQGLASIVEAQIPRIKKAGLAWVSKIEAAAVAPIAEMEFRGMCIDSVKWRQITTENKQERDLITGHILDYLKDHITRDLTGSTAFNLESNQDLLKVLHQLGHQVKNVKKQSLQQLPPPLGPWLLRYRELSKAVSTYGESFLRNLGADGRLHPTFEQIGASTGRMACHSPNIQAVLKTSQHRDCFRCAPHRRLVVADYATCELRILAQMSGDPVFRKAFAEGEDLHSRVASTLWNVPVSKSQNIDLRNRAKAVNFGLVYGMGVAGLAKTLNVPPTQAETLLRDYFCTFPKIRDFLKQEAIKALRRGYAETLTGRKLYFGKIHNSSERSQAERVAKNMPIQGSSADMTKLAMANLWTQLESLPNAWLINAVHDELVVECEATDAPEVVDILRNAMTQAGKSILPDIPIEVDISVSQTWNK